MNDFILYKDIGFSVLKRCCEVEVIVGSKRSSMGSKWSERSPSLTFQGQPYRKIKVMHVTTRFTMLRTNYYTRIDKRNTIFTFMFIECGMPHEEQTKEAMNKETSLEPYMLATGNESLEMISLRPSIISRGPLTPKKRETYLR